MLNHITVMGRLTRDPEVRILSNNVTLTQFTVAVDRDYQKAGAEKQTDFITCRAWCQTAEFIDRHFRKGQMIVIEGSLESSKWKDEQDGSPRTSWFIKVAKARFGEPKRKDDDAGDYPCPADSRPRKGVDVYGTQFTDLPDDGELPF